MNQRKRKHPSGKAATRREGERLSLSLPVAVRRVRRATRAAEKTHTVDLSRSGASFHSRHSYRPGEELRLKFLETENLFRQAREVPARVARVIRGRRKSGAVVAVRFEDPGLATLVLSELLRAKMRTSSALLEVVQAVTPEAEAATVVEAICRATERALQAEQALLFLFDRDANLLRARHQRRDFQIEPGVGLVGSAAAASQAVNVPELVRESRYRPQQEPYFTRKTRSVLCLPLSREEGVSPGVLVVSNRSFGPFTREDEELGAAIAGQISTALRQARLFEDIRAIKSYNENILESIGTGVLTFDPAGRLATLNRAAAGIFGLDPAAAVGKEHTQLFTGAANVRLCGLVAEALRSGEGRRALDARFLRRDRVSVSLDANALPLSDAHGRRLGVLLAVEDITYEQRVMNTLCRYMAREVAEQMLKDKSKLRLGGTRAQVTILFADIRNFTTLSEQMDPAEVVSLLNSYYPRMINVIFRHQGMVDKFIGDAILAVFGVPAPRPDDALRAVRAALAMRRELGVINQERQARGLLSVEIGIGITSGTVISGNIGSERRMDFTVIGDPVNLAARLEGMTKEVARKILINEDVHAAVRKQIRCEELGRFKIKGKREEVPVYAVETPA